MRKFLKLLIIPLLLLIYYFFKDLIKMFKNIITLRIF